jgi:2-dehydropantoate 2-reductase
MQAPASASDRPAELGVQDLVVIAVKGPALTAVARDIAPLLGPPAGGKSERVQRVVDLLGQAGFDVTHSADVRYDIWYKLWGNMTMNPVSAITGATIDRVLADKLVRDFCSAAMLEAAAIGERIGCKVEQTPEDRHAVMAKLGTFKSSMLQDVEAGRPIELDAIVTAVYEMGQRLRQPMPNTGALLGMARLFGRVHGIYTLDT